MKKLFLFMFCVILLSGIVSAWEIDNIKQYNSDTRTATFKNTFLLIPTSTIATATLLTPHNVKVAPSPEKQPVARMRIEGFTDYKDILKEMKFYDMKKGKLKISRNYDLKMFNGMKEVSEDVYGCLSEGVSENGTVGCVSYGVIGTRLREVEDWKKLTQADIKKNEKLIIEIWTVVEDGDYVDWVGTFFGVEVPEWATWEADLKTSLTAYYQFDTNAQDVHNSNHGSVSGAVLTTGSGGIIGEAYSFDGSNDYIAVPDYSLSSAWTVSMWVKPDVNNVLGYLIDASSGRTIMEASEDGKFRLTGGIASSSFSTASYSHLVATSDGTNLELFLNGISQGTAVSSVDLGGTIKLGLRYASGTQPYDGKMDEVGIWSRELSQTEIEFLHNGGDGLTYEDDGVAPDSPPTINLISPSDNQTYSTSPVLIDFTCYASDDINLTEVKLLINGEVDQTNASGLNDTTYTFTKSLSDGDYNWTCEAYDNESQSAQATERSLFIDSVAPSLSLTSPIENTTITLLPTNITLNTTSSDTHLDSCWYSTNENSTNISYSCNTLSNVSLSNEGEYIIYYCADDTFGNKNCSSVSNYIFHYEYIQTYSPVVLSNLEQTINLEATISEFLNVVAIRFIYDEVIIPHEVYITGNNYSIESTFLTPVVESETNKSFYFEIELDDFIIILEETNQTIIPLLFDNCGAYNYSIYNLSLKDEATKESMLGYFESNNQIYSIGRSEAIAEYSYITENKSNSLLCSNINITELPITLSSEIKYYAPNYVYEFYHIQEASLGNFPINISLFNLASDSSTEFQISYKNSAGRKVEEAVIQLQRKYISTGSYEVVEAPITSSAGETIIHIDLNSNKYKAVVVKNNEVLDIFDNILFKCENELSGICYHDLKESTETEGLISYDILKDFSFTILEENNTLKVVYSIPSGTPSLVAVQMEQKNQFSNNTLCNKSVTSSGGSLECDYFDSVGDSVLVLKIFKDGELQKIKSFLLKEKNAMGDMNGTHLFIVILLIMSLTGMSYSSPEWIVGNGVLSLVVASSLWLIDGFNLVVGLGGVAYLIVGAAILINKLAKQEDL